MSDIAADTVIPNLCFIGVRDLLLTNAQSANDHIVNDKKQIPHRLRRIRNDMVRWLHGFRNDMPQDVRH
jgi:hypothetical protein